MTGLIVRGLINRGDLAQWAGGSLAVTRMDASGGLVSGNAIGNAIDVLQVFGGGSSQNRDTMASAVQRLGTAKCSLSFMPGVWAIDNNLTVPANFTCLIPSGCVFSVDSGKTLTFLGPIQRESETWTAGSGTVVYTPSSNVLLHTADLFPRTAAEISAGVTPINYAKVPSPWKDISRFVDDNTGVTDVSTEMSHAFAAEKNIIIPEGTYLLDGATALLCRDGLHIQGAGKEIAVLKLGPNAGTGAAALRWDGNVGSGYDVHLENFKILLQNAGKAQIGVRLYESRHTHIERVKIFGQGTVSDDTTAIKFDGSATFSGAGTVIDSCYLSNNLIGVDVQGTSTDIIVSKSAIYGTANHATSKGVNVSTGSDGLLLLGNSITQLHRCVYSEGTNLKQIGNRFENATAPWEWVRGAGHARIWAQSLGDEILGVGVPIYPVNDTDLCIVLSGPGYSDFDLMTLNADRGFTEYLRTTKMGEFTRLNGANFSAGNYTASGSMTFTVLTGQVTDHSLSVNGHTATMKWNFSGSTIGGTPSTAIRLLIPGSFTAKGLSGNAVSITNNGASSVGWAQVADGGTFVSIYISAAGSSAWTASAGNAGSTGQLTFEIN